jgi:Polyketide cyclase / dehydrase and lipid transport
MATWSNQIRCSGTPEQVLRLLTEPQAIARWSPVGFELRAFDGERLRAGDRVRVSGSLAGRSVEFLVDVASASDGRLALTASGPIRIGVEYLVRAVGPQSDVQASVEVAGGGLLGRMLACATDALLAAGALRASLARIAGELDPALA